MFFQKKYEGRIVDVHSHFLPGVDDGAENAEMSLEMLRIAEKEGITDIIVTPHWKADRKSITPDSVIKCAALLEKMARQQQMNISVFPGNEVMYCAELEEILKEKKVCPMNLGNRILIEFMPITDFNTIVNAMSIIQGQGYIPVLAHAERVDCLVSRNELVEELIDRGVEIQVNAGSIAGKNGPEAKKFTRNMLKNENVDYIGTDAHSAGRRAPEMKKCVSVLQKICSEKYMKQVLYKNARDNFELSRK